MNGESKSFFSQRPSLEVFATPMIYSLTILKGFLLQQLSLNVLSRSSSDFPLYTPCACFWTKNSFDKESLRERETTLLAILITASKWLLFFLLKLYSFFEVGWHFVSGIYRRSMVILVCPLSCIEDYVCVVSCWLAHKIKKWRRYISFDHFKLNCSTAFEFDIKIGLKQLFWFSLFYQVLKFFIKFSRVKMRIKVCN